jgi:hypothetical protein
VVVVALAQLEAQPLATTVALAVLALHLAFQGLLLLAVVVAAVVHF